MSSCATAFWSRLCMFPTSWTSRLSWPLPIHYQCLGGVPRYCNRFQPFLGQHDPHCCGICDIHTENSWLPFDIEPARSILPSFRRRERRRTNDYDPSIWPSKVEEQPSLRVQRRRYISQHAVSKYLHLHYRKRVVRSLMRRVLVS